MYHIPVNSLERNTKKYNMATIFKKFTQFIEEYKVIHKK